MKLLLENWRRYLTEANIQSATRLSIFDFDETIAYAKGYIDVYEKGTKNFVKRITTQEEYDEIKVAGDYDYDFDALDQIEDPQEVKSITNIMRSRIKDSQTQVMILTARTPAVEDDIHRYLATLEQPIDTSEVYVKGLTGGNKGQYILSVLQEFPNITSVEFYDDSTENIKDMLAAKQRVQNVSAFDIYHVTAGRINLVK
jgi:hypothetical protein